MTPWMWMAILAAACYGTNNLFVKLASGRLPDAVGAVVIQGTCMVVVSLYCTVVVVRAQGPLPWSWAGVWPSVGSGLCLGAGVLLLFAAFRMGGPVSLVVPVLLSGQLVIAAVAGVMAFHEGVSLSRMLGLFLCMGGVWLAAR